MSAFYTVALTGRFLVAWFPRLERRRNESPWVHLVAATDPLLEPVRRAVPMRVAGSLDVTPLAVLGAVHVLTDALIGAQTGALLAAVPYAPAQEAFQALNNSQVLLCLPMWLMVVARYIGYA